MAKRLSLKVGLFLLAMTGIVMAQAFNVYIGSLPGVTLPFGPTDAVYVLQTPCINTTCTSKQATAYSLLGAGQGYPIAGLPACSATTNIGLRAYVTNGAASPTYQSAVGATGAATNPVFCNGTGWIYD